MKSENHERELFEQLLQQRNQPVFGDLRRGGHDLPLRYFVDRVEVIQAFDAVLVALMNGVDAQIAGAALRPRFAPLADGAQRGPRRLITGVALAVNVRVAEPIDLRHRYARHALVGRLAVFAELALQYPLRRRAAQVP